MRTIEKYLDREEIKAYKAVNSLALYVKKLSFYFYIRSEIHIFASAMSGYELQRLKLEALSQIETPYVLSLDNDFFTQLEQEEILGGLLAIKLIVQKRAGNSYEIRYSAQGTVQVNCDRCLDALDLFIDFEETATIAAYDEDGYELLNREGEYDAQWDVFEAILLHIPLHHSHEEGQCNPEQEQLLQKMIVE